MAGRLPISDNFMFGRVLCNEEVCRGFLERVLGIEVGDIITEFDGKTVSSSSDLMLDVRTKQPGDVVSVTANRDGEEMQFEVTLGKSEKASAQSESQQNSSSQGNSGSGQGQGQGQGGQGQGQGGTIEDLLRQFGR